MENEFMVPLARDILTDELVSSAFAEKHRKYVADGCGCTVYKREGPKTRAHFYHATGKCSGGETPSHKRGKNLLKKSVDGEGDPIIITINVNCEECGQLHERLLILDQTYHGCLEHRYRIAKGNHYIFDLAVFDKSYNLIFVVEVENTSPMSQQKRDELSEEGLAYFELTANSILEYPRNGPINPITSGRYMKVRNCRENEPVVTEISRFNIIKWNYQKLASKYKNPTLYNLYQESKHHFRWLIRELVNEGFSQHKSLEFVMTYVQNGDTFQLDFRPKEVLLNDITPRVSKIKGSQESNSTEIEQRISQIKKDLFIRMKNWRKET